MTIFAPPDHPLHPYEFYADRRRNRPVVYDPAQEAWGVYRFADVKAVLSDYANFSSEFPRFRQDPSYRESLINVDPPKHWNLRGVISKAFTPGAIEKLAPRIEALSEQLLDELGDCHRFDLVSRFAHPLPVMIIAEMLGVPAEDRPQYKRWADELLGGNAETMLTDERRFERARVIQQEMDAYFRNVLAERRRHPQDDLISHLLSAEVDGERLTEEGMLSFCTLLLLAGHITTVNLITNGMLCLFEHPETIPWLRGHPEAMPRAIEEMLRYRSPVQWLARTAKRDIVLGGERIKEGQLVIAFVGSANRDETVFEDAERFEPTRYPNPHLSMGHGVHYCLGAPLARLEGAIAMRALLERFPECWLDLTPGEELTPASNSLIHGVSRLPMGVSTRLAS